MTESNPASTAPDQANPAGAEHPTTEPTDPGGTKPPEPPEPSSGNSEAAKYRRQLRDAEATRDKLAERLTGYQRRQCEAAVADLLEQPGDLWDLGKADPTAFFGEDDTLNDAELRAAAGALLDMRPGLAKQPTPGPRVWGQHGGTPPGRAGIGWTDVLKT